MFDANEQRKLLWEFVNHLYDVEDLRIVRDDVRCGHTFEDYPDETEWLQIIDRFTTPPE